jgi:dTDP-4-dehydrorhamnose reductase
LVSQQSEVVEGSKIMKIMITGSGGMLGGAFYRELSDRYDIVGLDVHENEQCGSDFVEADITQKEETIEKISSRKPDLIIHTAAYTDVDGCENNEELAHKVNATGTQNIALAAKECKAFLYYISTDFVFDGEKDKKYIEADTPNPINKYGHSKLEGEGYVQSILKKGFIIVRSSWLFGRGGRNFVDTFLQKAHNEKEIKVVNDQFGSPTYTEDLAAGIAKLIPLTKGINGIYHITNSGSCSWYDFALAIKEMAGLDTEVMPIASEQYSSPTKRPKMSILENKRFRECTGETLRHWKEALKEYLYERKNFNR